MQRRRQGEGPRHGNLKRLSLLALVGWFLAGGTAWAIQRAMSLRELCVGAEHIVVGTVLDVQGYPGEWPGVGHVVFSDVTIAVDEAWKGGLAGQRLVVQTPGGTTADGMTLVACEFATFAVGERVLVFVHTHANLQRPWVFGHQQGKYRIIGRRVVSQGGFPIAEDILLPGLEREVRTLLAPATGKGG